MFLGNLISDLLIGGIFVGLVSDKVIHLPIFATMWSLVTVISVFTFQRNEFKRFEALVKSEEGKSRFKTTRSPKVVWLAIRLFSSFILSLMIGFVVLSIKESLGF